MHKSKIHMKLYTKALYKKYIKYMYVMKNVFANSFVNKYQNINEKFMYIYDNKSGVDFL